MVNNSKKSQPNRMCAEIFNHILKKKIQLCHRFFLILKNASTVGIVIGSLCLLPLAMPVALYDFYCWIINGGLIKE